MTGAEGRERRYLSSININPPAQEITNFRLMRRWQEIEENEVRYKEYFMDDAKLLVTGFGSAGRVALSAVRAAREEGIPVGLIRPVTLSPFPRQVYADVAKRVDSILVVEMNNGQMLDDVLLATRGQVPVEFYGRMGGVFLMPDEVLAEIHRMAAGGIPNEGHPRDRWLNRVKGLI